MKRTRGHGQSRGDWPRDLPVEWPVSVDDLVACACLVARADLVVDVPVDYEIDYLVARARGQAVPVCFASEIFFETTTQPLFFIFTVWAHMFG